MSLLKLPNDENGVPRFSRAQRILHWLNAALFMVAFITGLSFVFPLLEFVSFGHPKAAVAIHAGIGLCLGGAVCAVYFLIVGKHPIKYWQRHLSYLRSNKYNAGQKVNITLTAFSLLLLMVSGVLLTAGKLLPVTLLKIAYFLHNLAAFAMLFFMGGHLFLSIVHPSTNRSLMGMILGKVDETYAKDHHAEWHREVREADKK